MKFKDLITNIMGSTLIMIPLFYLFVDWFFGMATGHPNYSHFIDIMIYPFMALVWMLMSRGTPFTKFVIWTNRLAFIITIVIVVIFFRNLSEGTYVPSDRQITEISENNCKYFIEVSDTLTYYIDKNDTITYDTASWKVYQFVREDMFKDTIFGNYSLSNGNDFLYLNLVDRR